MNYIIIYWNAWVMETYTCNQYIDLGYTWDCRLFVYDVFYKTNLRLTVVTFVDKDECLDPKTCGQKCNNLPGGYQCSCLDGYLLGPDSSSCIGRCFLDVITTFSLCALRLCLPLRNKLIIVAKAVHRFQINWWFVRTPAVRSIYVEPLQL